MEGKKRKLSGSPAPRKRSKGSSNPSSVNTFSRPYTLYSYKLNGHKCGIFEDTKEEFFIVERKFEADVTFESMSLQKQWSHPNQLRCIDIDPQSGFVFYDKYWKTFREYLEFLNANDVSLVESIEVEGLDLQKRYAVEIRIVREIIRYHLQGLVKYLIKCHDRGLFTTGFTLDNLVVSSGEVAYYNLNHKQAFGNEEKQFTRADFRCLYDVFSEVFGSATLPKDMTNFLHNLREETQMQLGEVLRCPTNMLHEHIAVLSDHERLAFLSNVHEKMVGSRKKPITSCIESTKTSLANWTHKQYTQYTRKDKKANILKNLHMFPSLIVDDKYISATLVHLFWDNIIIMQREMHDYIIPVSMKVIDVTTSVWFPSHFSRCTLLSSLIFGNGSRG
ncbi:hypothetical protein M5689_007386 [Euphorbia peplus]|nr:hypothetical protein M5689_007386 [Euphorbia peplus]